MARRKAVLSYVICSRVLTAGLMLGCLPMNSTIALKSTVKPLIPIGGKHSTLARARNVFEDETTIGRP